MNPTPSSPDQAFTDFFQAQVPNVWPACPATAAEPRRAAAGDPRWSSRAALAASVVLLLGVGTYFSAAPVAPPPAGPNDTLLRGATADGNRLLKPAPRPDALPRP